MITAHRRENLGQPTRNMFRQFAESLMYPNINIYPTHESVVRETARLELGGCDRIRIIEPLDVLIFIISLRALI